MAGNERTLVAVVCDAGPLIHLDEVGCLDLLGSFQRVLVPESVWIEVASHRPQALNRTSVSLEKIPFHGIVSPELESLSRGLLLHAGELAALHAAQTQPGCWLLSDDTAARLAARTLGVTAHGSIGILLRALRRKERTKAEILTVLRALPRDSTLHIKRSLLADIIRDVEEAE